jgi:hypothetical protein
LFGALAGAGGAVADIAKTDQAATNDENRAKKLAELEEQKQLRIEEVREARKRQAGIQQGSEIEKEASRLLGEGDAAAINAKFGSSANSEDVASLAANPAARKLYGLPEDSRLTQLERRAMAAEKLGYTDSAKNIRDLIQTEVTNLRNKANDESTNRRLDISEAESKRGGDIQDKLAAAQIADMGAQREYQASRDELNDKREQRRATKEALDGKQALIRDLVKELTNPMIDDSQKSLLSGALREAREDAKVLTSALASVGIKGSERPEPKGGFDPANYQLGGKQAPSGGNAAPASQEAEAIRPRLSGPSESFPPKYSEKALDRDRERLNRTYEDKIATIQPGMLKEKQVEIRDWLAYNRSIMTTEQLKRVEKLIAKAGF